MNRSTFVVHVNRLIALTILAMSQPVDAIAEASFDPEARLAELKLQLPRPDAPIANYVRAVQSGNLLFVAGHAECGDKFLSGKVGGAVTLEQAYESARRTGVCLLATVKAELGDLRRVKRIVKVFGMVDATPDFEDHSKVINGCSDLLVAVFGERGRHARTVAGMTSMPLDTSVEIEMIVEIEDAR